MRRWIPWTLLAVLGLFTIASAVVGATTHSGQTTVRYDLISPFYTPNGAVIGVTPLNPIQGGYRGIEDFCAVAPLNGTMHYDGTTGELAGVLTIKVHDLPPHMYVMVNWSNNGVRAPELAFFETDASGSAIQSSVNADRLPETKGVGILLTSARSIDYPFGKLDPC